MQGRAKESIKEVAKVVGGTTSWLLKVSQPTVVGTIAHHYLQTASNITDAELQRDMKSGLSYVSTSANVLACTTWSYELARVIIATKAWEYLHHKEYFTLSMLFTLAMVSLAYSALSLGDEQDILTASGSATLSIAVLVVMIEYLNSKSSTYAQASKFKFLVMTEEGGSSDEDGMEMTQTVRSRNENNDFTLVSLDDDEVEEIEETRIPSIWPFRRGGK